MSTTNTIINDMGVPMIVSDPMVIILPFMLTSLLGLIVYMLFQQINFINRYTMFKLGKNTALEFSREGREWFTLLKVQSKNNSVSSTTPPVSVSSFLFRFVQWTTGHMPMISLLTSYIFDFSKNQEEEIKRSLKISEISEENFNQSQRIDQLSDRIDKCLSFRETGNSKYEKKIDDLYEQVGLIMDHLEKNKQKKETEKKKKDEIDPLKEQILQIMAELAKNKQEEPKKEENPVEISDVPKEQREELSNVSVKPTAKPAVLSE